MDRLLIIHQLDERGACGKPLITRLEGKRAVSAVDGLELDLEALRE